MDTASIKVIANTKATINITDILLAIKNNSYSIKDTVIILMDIDFTFRSLVIIDIEVIISSFEVDFGILSIIVIVLIMKAYKKKS
jgi:hypothetical protein